MAREAKKSDAVAVPVAARGGPDNVLELRDLRLHFDTYAGTVKALDRVNLEIRRGETLGLVGESGCGKSVTAMTVMRLIPEPPGVYDGGEVLFGARFKLARLASAPSGTPPLADKGTVGSSIAGAVLARFDCAADGAPRTGQPSGEESRRAGLIARAALRACGAKDASALAETKVERLSPDERKIAEAALEWAMHPRESYPVNLLELPETEMQRVRGNDISMIFQEPMTSLNPVIKVGDQIAEAILRHQSLGVDTSIADRLLAARGIHTKRERERRRRARDLAAKMLQTIGIPDPVAMLERYPHELSGGMRQRVMIAMALATNPDLLIADEPTTALDVTIQAQIMELMKELKTRIGASILLITHHLGIVAEMCDRVSVMYAGHVIETATSHDIFKEPKHPYTLALLRSIPDTRGEERSDLPTITGTVPNLIDPPKGCRFHPRCPFAFAKCSEERPPFIEVTPGHRAACHLWSTPGVQIPPELKPGAVAKGAQP